MAYTLNATTGSAVLEWAPVTTYPFSLSIVAEHDSLATEGYPLGLCYHTGPNTSFFIGFRGDMSGDPIVCRRINAAGAGTNSPQSAAYSINTPTRIVVVAQASNDVRLYVNGTKTTTTTDATFSPASATRTSIGAFLANSAYSSRCGGRVQQAAAWDNCALTDAEAESLNKGFSPRRIRPQSLKMYVPCLRIDASYPARTTVLTTNVTRSPHMRTYGM